MRIRTKQLDSYYLLLLKKMIGSTQVEPIVFYSPSNSSSSFVSFR